MNWKGFTEWLKNPADEISWKRVLRWVEVILVLTLVIYLAPIALNLFFGWKVYGYFFERFTEYGVPGHLSGILAVWFTAMILWFGPTIIISLLKHRKDWIWKSAIIISVCLGVIYVISYPYSNSLFNPFTGQPNFRYSKNSDGIIEKFPRAFTVNPQTGLPLKDFNSEIAQEYLNPGPSLKDIILRQKTEIENLGQELSSLRDSLTDREQDIKHLINKMSKMSEVEKKASTQPQTHTTPEAKYIYRPAVFSGGKYSNLPFRIEILSTERVGESNLKLNLLIRYLGEGFKEMELTNPEQTSYLVDTVGNRYAFLNKGDFIGVDTFPGGVDVKKFIFFLAPPPDTKRINVILQCNVNWGFGVNIVFRNLDLNSIKLIDPL
ncbi:MAG: hypothetical protein WC394_03900 [Candidatus Omnitrophota bacterium]|jgi:hypothetical protein